jgi:hypothetical protein
LLPEIIKSNALFILRDNKTPYSLNDSNERTYGYNSEINKYTFEEILAYAKKTCFTIKVGIVLEDTNLIVFDFDKCITSKGRFYKLICNKSNVKGLEELIDLLKSCESYCELSDSDTGLHYIYNYSYTERNMMDKIKKQASIGGFMVEIFSLKQKWICLSCNRLKYHPKTSLWEAITPYDLPLLSGISFISTDSYLMKYIIKIWSSNLDLTLNSSSRELVDIRLIEKYSVSEIYNTRENTWFSRLSSHDKHLWKEHCTLFNRILYLSTSHADWACSLFLVHTVKITNNLTWQDMKDKKEVHLFICAILYSFRHRTKLDRDIFYVSSTVSKATLSLAKKWGE